jgi:hypothetical protein
MKIALLSLVLLAAAPAPDSEDAQVMAPHAEWITRQRSRIGALCCSLADGRPARCAVKGLGGRSTTTGSTGARALISGWPCRLRRCCRRPARSMCRSLGF